MKLRTASRSLERSSDAPLLGEVLGSFDAPAFARRGRELELSLERLHTRCASERLKRLEGVRLRLKQWAAATQTPDAWNLVFSEPIDALWVLAGADPPKWGAQTVSRRRAYSTAKTLISSALRFNRGWENHLRKLNLQPLNLLIEHYNTYYLIEKECFLRSARLAARHFQPAEPLTAEHLLAKHPLLPVPKIAI